MALKSTIFKANLQIADIDHGYYADHALTLARHPSETDERMMVRLVALALHAHAAAGRLQRRRHAGVRRRPVRPRRSGRLADRLHRPQAPVDRGRPARGQAAHQGLQQGRRGGGLLPSTTPPKSGGRASRPSSRAWRTCRSGASRPRPRSSSPSWPSAACSCRPRCRRARSRSAARRAACTWSRCAGSRKTAPSAANAGCTSAGSYQNSV